MTRAHDIAVEHCLRMKLMGFKPCDVLAPIGFPHNPQTTWDAAVRLVARAWSKLDSAKRAAS